MFSGTAIDFDDAILTNDGFWPDLSVKDFQSQRAIPADIDAATIRQALLTAAGEINDDLIRVVADCRLSGHASAADVPGVRLTVKICCAPVTARLFLPAPKLT